MRTTTWATLVPGACFALLATGILPAVGSPPDVLIYKVASNRTARLNQVFDLGTVDEAPGATHTSIVTEREYWVLDRNTCDLVRIPYSRTIINHAWVREYEVIAAKYRLFDGALTTTESFEYQAIASPGRNATTITMRNLVSSEGPDGSSVFYLIGHGKPVPFVKAIILPGGAVSRALVFEPEVPRILKGNKIVTQIVANDLTSFPPSTYDAFRRESGPISATLDVGLVNKCRGALPPAGSGLALGSLEYATYLVQRTLERLGYQNTAP